MQLNKKHAEIEKAHIRSLALVAVTFLVANVVLLVGFASIANAQSMQAVNPAFELAQMLAAPERTSGFGLSAAQLGAASVMVLGLCAMGAGCLAFLSQYARSFKHQA